MQFIQICNGPSIIKWQNFIFNPVLKIIMSITRNIRQRLKYPLDRLFSNK